MNRSLTFVLLLAASPWIMAQEVRVWTPQPLQVDPFGRIQTTLNCDAGREACATVHGRLRSALGLYVFDPQGNCVAINDSSGDLFADRNVDWTPAASGPYEVQIRNLGVDVNVVDASAR